ncbi:MAG: hypothetical protein HN341_15240 [Verrucomicrobia bacterium]|jgi:hypothetical protein|nr:hypothetical protein [Verrucomicrobiota bacterium]
MEMWLRDLSEIVRLLLGGPETVWEYWLLLGLVLAVLMLAMYLVGTATRIPNLGNIRRLLALVLGLGFLACVWVGAQTYLLPYVETAWLRQVVLYGVPVVSAMLVVIPIQQAIFRSGYVATLITFVSSLALAALFMILANAVLDAVLDGEKESHAIKERKAAVNRLLDK